MADTLRSIRPTDPHGLERRAGLQSLFATMGLESAPTSVGRYVVRGKLGEGAMGAVFEAEDPKLGRLVAIKVIRRGGQTPGIFDDAPEAYIDREARALARFSHPNVVPVYDVGEDDGQLFVAMEHMAGGSLRRWLADHPPEDWVDIVTPFLQAGRGLAAAHAASVIHRDFKPDNVLVNGDGVAKVADFGLAVVVGSEDAPERSTSEGSGSYIVGTRPFMAPELWKGGRTTPRSDQYSFCASLLWALNEHHGAVPMNIRAALGRGMREDPRERWPSLDALLDALQRATVQPVGDRHRRSLIDRVQRIWLDGLLRASLDGRALVSLRIACLPELVDSPWESHQPGPETQLRTEDLPELFEVSNGALLIVGSPGAGKTTAALSLARSLLDAAREDASASIPVVLNLASFGARSKRRALSRLVPGRPRRDTLAAWVEDELVAKYRLPRRRVARWLETDELVLILDGLDELSASARAPCVEAINRFRRERAVPLVVACREDEYLASGTRLSLGGAARVCPIDQPAAEAWGLDEAPGESEDATLRTPLWLVIGGGVEHVTENAWDRVYDEYIDSALERPPALAKPEQALHRKRLRWLAANLARLDESDVWLDRMQVEWLPGLPRQMLAMAIGTLALFMATVIPSALGSMAVGRSALSGFFLGIGSLIIVLSFNRGLRVSTGEKMRWSGRAALRRAPIMVGIGVAVGGLYGLLMGRPLLAMLYLGATGGAATGVLLGLEYADRSRGIHPNDGLLLALRQWIVITLVSGLFIGACYGFVISPIYGRLFPAMLDAYPGINVSLMHAVQLGTVIGLAIGLIYGGAAILLHGAIRLALALTSPLPIRLVRWLDDATQRGLMRRVGGGYMFMHATLLEHLARPDSGH